MTWTEIHNRFKKLGDITGINKRSSYSLNIRFNYEGDVMVELGCYDINDWPRNIELGPFNNEEDAQKATLVKVIEAEKEVKMWKSGGK